jgi:hypothetical protein
MVEGAILGLLLILLFSGLMIGLTFFSDLWPLGLRRLRGYEELGMALERAVEAGERVHLSLGTGSLVSIESAPAFAGLTVLAQIAASTAMSDKPVVVSTGDGAMAVLAQDTLQAAYRKVGAETSYHPVSSRMLGPSPFSYAAGVPSMLSSEEVSVHILSGSFGPEGGLAADFGRRSQAFVLAGTDDVQTQALFYGTADHPLIGEELFAGGAYLGVGELHKASLRAQDVIRFIIVALILLGTLLKSLGVLG